MTIDVGEGGDEITSITITDSNNPSSTITLNLDDPSLVISTDENGLLHISGIDVSSLANGTLNVEVALVDIDGNTTTVTDSIELDKTVIGDEAFIYIDDLNNLINDSESHNVNVHGSLGDSNQVIDYVIISNESGNSTRIESTRINYNADGTFDILDIDLSTFNDGNLTVQAFTSNDEVIATSNITDLDRTYGDTIEDVPSIELVDASGNGTIVQNELTTNKIVGNVGAIGEDKGRLSSITISDSDNNTDDIIIDITNVTLDNNGGFVIENVDVSSLSDGELTITANYIDSDLNTISVQNTNEIVLDKTYTGVEASVSVIDDDLVINENESHSFDIEGLLGTNGTTVASITLTDDENNSVELPLDNISYNNGSYSLNNIDISSLDLVEGNLHVSAVITDGTNTVHTPSTNITYDITYGNDLNNNGIITAPSIDIIDNSGNDLITFNEKDISTIKINLGEDGLEVNEILIYNVNSSGDKIGNAISISTADLYIDEEGNARLDNVSVDGLNNGTVKVEALLTDVDGNTIKVYDDIQYSSTYGVQPGTFILTDDVGSVIGTLEDGDITDDTRPTVVLTLSDEYKEGDIINVYDGDTLIASSLPLTNEDLINGSINIDIPNDLSQGEHPISLVLSRNGEDSGHSEIINITIDTTPSTIESFSMEDSFAYLSDGTAVGKDDNVTNKNVLNVYLGEENETGSTIYVYMKNDSGEYVLVDNKGVSSIDNVHKLVAFNLDLPENGDYDLKVAIKNANGVMSEMSDPYTFTYDTNIKTPTITALENTNEDDATIVTMSGSAEANSVVEIFDVVNKNTNNTVSLGYVTTNENGDWTFEHKYDQNSHYLMVQSIDNAGNKSFNDNAVEVFVGTDGKDTIVTLDSKINYIFSAGGNDDILGTSGVDIINGGTGADVEAAYFMSSEAIQVDLRNINTDKSISEYINKDGDVSISGGDARGDMLSNINFVTGSVFDDQFILKAGVVNDTDVNYSYYYQSNNIVARGDAGNDTFIALDEGSYLVQGGEGFDTIMLFGNEEDYTYHNVGRIENKYFNEDEPESIDNNRYIDSFGFELVGNGVHLRYRTEVQELDSIDKNIDISDITYVLIGTVDGVETTIVGNKVSGLFNDFGEGYKYAGDFTEYDTGVRLDAGTITLKYWTDDENNAQTIELQNNAYEVQYKANDTITDFIEGINNVYEYSNDVLVDGQDGYDILEISDSMSNINFDDVANNVSNIDQIDLSSSDKSITNVSLDDVLSINNGHDLVFVGDDGDTIDLSNNDEWIKSENTTTIEGRSEDFYEYTNTNNSVKIFIDEDINVV